jgi:hypothetical protein
MARASRDYERHGTTTLFAGLIAAVGKRLLPATTARGGCGGANFQGSRSAMRLTGWAAMRLSTLAR